MTPSHSGTDWVAHEHPDVIDEVDGLPSTHTHPEPQTDRTVTTDPANSGPLPFAAPFSIGAAPAVVSMSAIVLLATAIAVLRLYTDHPHRVHILAGVLSLIAVECVVLALGVVVRGRR